jgi:hypothetical protein
MFIGKSGLEDRVNKGCDRRTLGDDQQAADCQQYEDQREHPEFPVDPDILEYLRN